MAEWTRERRRWGQLAGLALGLGVLAGLVLAPQPGAGGAAPAAAHWVLPSAQRPLSYREADFLTLLRAPQWGAGAAGAAGGAAGGGGDVAIGGGGGGAAAAGAAAAGRQPVYAAVGG